MQRWSRPEVCISARQLGQSKRGTAARFLQVSQQPWCISQQNRARAACEAPASEPHTRPEPLHHSPAAPGAEQRAEQRLLSLEERCLKVNRRWVLWASSMGTAI